MNRTNLIEDLTLLPLPVWWQAPWFLATAALLLAAALVAGVLWWRRRVGLRAVGPVAMPEPDRTGEFLRRLEELRARQAEFSAYDLAISCSDLLREFVEWRFRLAIRFQTTREFLEAAARDAALPPAERERLGHFLRFCDLVKFARQGATSGELSGLLDLAESFIRQSQAVSTVAGSRSGE